MQFIPTHPSEFLPQKCETFIKKNLPPRIVQNPELNFDPAFCYAYRMLLVN